ncbi:MAG: polysaccharide biosynthesis tyrosine autokinase [Desulfuromonadales bacterium]|nr:polysaccharide biosynthesis tyrosine autokinase [Desulfuromonadales bacterium]
MAELKNGLRDNLKILNKRRNVIAIVVLGVFCVVLIGTLATTPQYEGVAKIIIERVQANNLTGDNRYQPLDPQFDQTQFQLIRSHAVARRVVKILKLEDDFELRIKPEGESWLSTIRSNLLNWVKSLRDEPAEVSPVESAPEGQAEWSKADLVALKMARNISVAPSRGSHITIVSYASPNPSFSALTANTFIQAYLEETLSMKLEATRRNLEWMSQKAEVERLKLQTAEKQLQEYMEKNDLVSLEDRVTIIPERLGQFGRDLVRAETKTKENRLLYDKVKGVSGNLDAAETVLSISEGGSLDVLRAQILKAEQYKMELSNKYGTKHPVIIKAQADLNVLRSKRRQEIKRIIEKVKNQYELALLNENSIRGQLNEAKAESLELNEKYVRYSVIKREIETNKQLNNALLTKIKEQSITGETRPVNIWIVEHAKVPKKPVRPVVAANLILGLLFGLCCGVSCAFLINHLDNRIKSTEGLGDDLGIPILGGVPFNSEANAMKEIVRTAPLSVFAESYNALRTTLLLSSVGTPPKRILVTSSIAGEGKTTTAVNLALTMAKSGSRVLLLDADLRKPNIHKVFKLRNKTGLSSFLSGGSGKSILFKSSQENLLIIPAGPVPPNPYELLNSDRMVGLIESLGEDFDVIICDSPPIFPISDSRLLSRAFDGLIMVARSGLTTYPMAHNSIKLLRDVNAKIIGLVVNAIHARDQEEYYSYYSNYMEEADKAESVEANVSFK